MPASAARDLRPPVGPVRFPGWGSGFAARERGESDATGSPGRNIAAGAGTFGFPDLRVLRLWAIDHQACPVAGVPRGTLEPLRTQGWRGFRAPGTRTA